MIYIFDKKQTIIKVLTNEDLTAGHLDLKINTATTFEFSLPANKPLPSNAKYVAVPHPLNSTKFILLRLTERTDNVDTIDYSAYELAYQELATDGYIADKRPSNQDALTLMKTALNGSNWELNNVNVAGTASTNFYYIDHLTAISKVVELLGGEIVFYVEIQGNTISGRYMDYLARQGEDTSKVFANGSNLLTIERQSDTSGIYTAILPRGKGVETDGDNNELTPDGYGRRLNIADAIWKKSDGKPLNKPSGEIILYDPTANAEWGQIDGNYRLLLETYDDVDDVNTLINSAYKTLQSVNHPKIQYSATVADVGGLSLGDTVLIMHGNRKLSYKTRVFEVNYDLLDTAKTEISLGDDLSSNDITSQINNLNVVADNTSSQTQWTINQIGRPRTTYGAIAPDSPKVGDIWFKYLADGGTEIYRWNGDIWELLASPTTADDISTAVDDAVTQAKSHVEEVKQGILSDIDTAKSQAASQASTAEANAKSKATAQFNQAKDALAEAKENLQSDIDESKGNIVEINKTLTGFDGTLQRVQDEVNGLGQTNQLMNTEFTPDLQGWNQISNAYQTGVDFFSGSNVIKVSQADGNYLYQDVPVTAGVVSFSSIMQIDSGFSGAFQFAINFRYSTHELVSGSTTYWSNNNTTPMDYVLQKLENIAVPIGATYVRINYGFTGTGVARFAQPMLVFSDHVGAYVQGNYNNNDALAKVKLTADQASLDLSTYTQDADERIHKAQSGIEANATAITKMVSQTDYDKKTGELSNKLNTTTDTADGTKQALSDYKEYANGNISGLSSDLRKVAGEVNLKLSKTDYDDSQSILNTSLSQWKGDYDGWTGIVSNLSTKVNNLGQVNQLFNTEFSPDLQGWYASPNLSSQSYPTINTLLVKSNLSYDGSNAVMIDYSSRPDDYAGYTKMYQDMVNVYGHSILSWSMAAYLEQASSNGNTYFNATIDFFDKDMTFISNAAGRMFEKTKIGAWQNSSDNNSSFLSITIPANAYYAGFKFYPKGQFKIHLSKPMVIFDSPTVGAYVAGAYNNNAALAQVKITADSISNFVRDSSGNISSDFQTALSRTSIITGSTLASSIQKQTSSQISSALTDNNGKIISLINQDTSGVQIAGKNITLDGNTTVTGDFYAKGGNFKNLNASNFTTGTINAAKINVINLDVSSLSGNITNFIKSYWNNAYSNVTIDGNGMSITAGKKRTDFKNGAINIQTQRGENLGFLGTASLTKDDTVDYLTLALNGYHTTNRGDDRYDPSSKDFYGGDGISFDVSNSKGNYEPVMRWNSKYAADIIGTHPGWQMLDHVFFEKGIFAHNAPDNFKVSWTSWSDWGNRHTISLTNQNGSAGIAVNGDNLVLFGQNKRTDATKGWKV